MRATEHVATASAPPTVANPCGRIVLVLQGGGALGAYQAGVYQALHEAGMEPDWVIGTSIGAINASLIVGNAIEDRLTGCRSSGGGWSTPCRCKSRPAACRGRHADTVDDRHGRAAGVSSGPTRRRSPALNGRWAPRPPATIRPSHCGRRLTELVDFGRINRGNVRLTVGAANVRTSEMTYFDSRGPPSTCAM